MSDIPNSPNGVPFDPRSTPPPGAPFAPPAPAPMYESEARNISMWIHFAAGIATIVSAGTLAFAVPLVMWLIYKDRSALVDHHGKQNLNLQLTGLVVAFGAIVIGIITFFLGFFVTIPVWFVYVVYSLVMCFVAGNAAKNGQYYRIKFIIPFVK